MPTEGRGRGERGGPRWYCAPDLGDRGRGRSDGYRDRPRGRGGRAPSAPRSPGAGQRPLL